MNISRRTLVGGAIAAAGIAAGGTSMDAKAGPSGEASGGRIDTHHHFIPDVFVQTIGAERLASVVPNKKLPVWSVARALDVCGQFGISEAILSISPGYPALDAAVERPLMRKCNDLAATIRRDHPGKFGHFASIPMFDRGEALKEIEYAFGPLKADGVVVFSNYGGKYLGDPSFSEIWAELDRRHAVVFIHPTSPGYTLLGQPPESVAEFTFDTTRAAISLLFSGTTRRYPNISFVLSHAGGTLPYLAERIAGGAVFNPEVHARIPDVMAEIRRFWFDTALSGSRAALAALLTVADPERITYGSDFPYAPDFAIRANTAGVDRYPVDAALHAGIARGNAVKLLGRTA